MRRLGRKRSLTRLFLARLPFSLPFSQTEEARETREGMDGKGVPRVFSSRVSGSRYFLAKRKRRGRRAKAWKEKSLTRLFLARLLFPFPFSQAEEAQETRKDVEEKESHASLPRTSPVSISF